MNVTGIIAEYNPFHSGHRYQIEQAKAKTGADYCMIAMSGDFVQRGEPAFYHKYLRTRMALTCGADLVLEIPSVFATSSAEDFASCGVALFNQLNLVNSLCFGSEWDDLESILSLASAFLKESPALSRHFKEGLRQGLSWPNARAQALLQTNPDKKKEKSKEKWEAAKRILSSPNSLLGIEYCKAILKQHSSIKPVIIKRQGQGYHDLSVDEQQASASALRKNLIQLQSDNDTSRIVSDKIRKHIPEEIFSHYESGMPVTAQDCSALLNYTLLSLIHQGQDLSRYADVSADLAHRIQHTLLEYCSWEGRIRQLKTKQYTYTRISRCLVHILLGITKDITEQGRRAGYAPYARILGFRKEAAPLLSKLKKQSSIPLITKTSKAPLLLNDHAFTLFQQDLYASHVRQSIEAVKYENCTRNEFNQPVCIL